VGAADGGIGGVAAAGLRAGGDVMVETEDAGGADEVESGIEGGKAEMPGADAAEGPPYGLAIAGAWL